MTSSPSEEDQKREKHGTLEIMGQTVSTIIAAKKAMKQEVLAHPFGGRPTIEPSLEEPHSIIGP